MVTQNEKNEIQLSLTFFHGIIFIT